MTDNCTPPIATRRPPEKQRVKDLLRLIRSDYRRHVATGALRPLRTVLFTQGLWAAFVFRVTHYLYYRVDLAALRSPIRFFCQMARKISEILTGISLPPECKIGAGLYIGHFGTIIVSSAVEIGENCNLSQGVTLGYGGRPGRGGYPRIGDRVYIAANAVVIGNISVGDDAVIGAGAVVTKTVPPRAVIIGNPSQISSFKGSFDFIYYDDMKHDLARQAALAGGPPPSDGSF